MKKSTNSHFQPVKEFIKNNFRHFNAAVVVDASEAYVDHIRQGGKMMVAMGGAMSTAELGITLAHMIRRPRFMRSPARAPIWRKICSIWSFISITVVFTIIVISRLRMKRICSGEN